MEKLLRQYIRETNRVYSCSITIDYYNVDGAICLVKWTHNDGSYTETEYINIWDMIVFLNKD